MKLFKSIFSIIVVLSVLLCVGLPVFASSDTYSIEIPDGFTEFEAEGQDCAWKNADGSIIVNVAVSENTSKVKVNPNDAGESYMTTLENEMKASVTQKPELSAEIVTSKSEFMELGEHDAIRVFMHAKYNFENGKMDVYQICYIFETQNYIHAFVTTSDEDISEFSDKLIKTVKINDEAVARRSNNNDNKILGGVLGGAIKGALIGAAVGVVLALAKKFTGKKKAEEASEVATAHEANEPEANENQTDDWNNRF